MALKKILKVFLLILLLSAKGFGQQQNNQLMEQRLTLITLGVNDLEKSTDFYENVFGWKASDMSNEDITFYQLNDILLSLYERKKLAEDARVSPEGEGFKGFTMSYNARSREEVDQIMDNFKGKGVTIIKAPEEVFWGGYSGYISDPDGNLWEIAFNPYAIPDPKE